MVDSIRKAVALITSLAIGVSVIVAIPYWLIGASHHNIGTEGDGFAIILGTALVAGIINLFVWGIT